MQHTRCCTWPLLASMGALACASHPAPRPDAGVDGGSPDLQTSIDQMQADGLPGACGTIDPRFATGPEAELFAYAAAPTFDFFLPDQAWADLQAHARDEVYVEAQACFEGRAIGRVGLRFKGSYGSLYNCFDASGVNTCRKLGMKVKFDEIDPDLRFFGLKHLNFQSYHYDETYIKERLAYDTFRAMGIIAPRATWAILRVNGELRGLFGMVEEIDGRFTNDRWPANPDQNLFKEAWPTKAEPTWIADRLKTNKKTGDVSAFVAFSQAMLSAPEANLRSTLGAYTDLDYFARYMAVDDAIGNFDGVTTYYTSGDAAWAGNHNFYFYQETANRFTIIPWDLESSMLPNAGLGYLPRWTERPADCTLLYPVWGGSNQAIAPGCDRVFQALAADLTAYRAAGQKLLDGPLSEKTLLSAIDTHANFVRAHAISDPHGPGKTSFDGGLAYLRGQVPLLRARFQRLLSGASITPLELDATAPCDFEKQDDFGLQLGPTLMCNATSTVAVNINTTTPMKGTQDLVMKFAFANEATPWQQWSFYRIPMRGGAVDMTARTKIRMWMRADRDRTVRLDLDSLRSQGAMQGIRQGWDVPVSATPSQIEVKLADAAPPAWAIMQGKDPKDDPQAIRASVNGLVWTPQCLGRGASGQLPEGTTDPGFIEIDEVEFY